MDKSRFIIKELERRVKLLTYNFDIIFEIVREISLRAMEPEVMYNYLLMTMMGQFLVRKAVLFIKEEKELIPVKAVGEDIKKLKNIPIDIIEESLNYSLISYSENKEFFENLEIPREYFYCLPLCRNEGYKKETLQGLLLMGKRIYSQEFDEFQLKMLEIIGNITGICIYNSMLYKRSTVDALTGVFSRGYFDMQLEKEIKRCERYSKKGIGLAMLDIDNFKKFNDTYGHQTGDIVLQGIAKVLKEKTRLSDVVARYGGEEFSIIMVETDIEGAICAAQRLREEIEKRELYDFHGNNLYVTVSIGISHYPTFAVNSHTLIEQADIALYRAKNNGKNRVEVYNSKEREL